MPYSGRNANIDASCFEGGAHIMFRGKLDYRPETIVTECTGYLYDRGEASKRNPHFYAKPKSLNAARLHRSGETKKTFEG